MEEARNSAGERERERAGERESGRAVQLDSGASPDSPDSGPEHIFNFSNNNDCYPICIFYKKNKEERCSRVPRLSDTLYSANGTKGK